MKRDLSNNINVARAISPVSVSDNTAQVSQIIDTAAYQSLAFLIAIGSVADADATFAVTMDHGDDSGLSDAAAVPTAMMNGTLAGAGFQFDSDNGVRKIGYCGDKRYVRLTITPTNNASAALMSVVAVQGHPDIAPVSQ